MTQLAGPSATGLSGQNAFNETVETEHFGLAGWTKSTAATEPGVGTTSTGIRGESGGAEGRQEGMTSLQDLGVETMN